MRIPAIIVLACALAGCGEPRGTAQGPEPSAAAREEGILFAVSARDTSGTWLDPIALVTPGGLRDPWHVSVDSAFNARYFAPGTRYPFRVAGVPAGEVAVIEVEERVCNERLARVAATATRTLPARWEGLASDVFGAAPREPALRPATDAEKAILAALADSVHAARGSSRRHAAELVGLYAVAVNGIADPVLVGTSSISFESGVTEQVQSAMVVAERREGAYRPVYVWYADERGSFVRRRVLRDGLDVDGDGAAELIAQTTYYESWDYTFLRRTGEEWREIYGGGGGGC